MYFWEVTPEPPVHTGKIWFLDVTVAVGSCWGMVLAECWRGRGRCFTLSKTCPDLELVLQRYACLFYSTKVRCLHVAAGCGMAEWPNLKALAW